MCLLNMVAAVDMAGRHGWLVSHFPPNDELTGRRPDWTNNSRALDGAAEEKSGRKEEKKFAAEQRAGEFKIKGP